MIFIAQKNALCFFFKVALQFDEILLNAFCKLVNSVFVVTEHGNNTKQELKRIYIRTKLRAEFLQWFNMAALVANEYSRFVVIFFRWIIFSSLLFVLALERRNIVLSITIWILTQKTDKATLENV